MSILNEIADIREIQKLTESGFLALQYGMLADAEKIFQGVMQARKESKVVQMGLEIVSFLGGNENAINQITHIVEELDHSEKDLVFVLAFLLKIAGYNSAFHKVAKGIGNHSSLYSVMEKLETEELKDHESNK